MHKQKLSLPDAREHLLAGTQQPVGPQEIPGFRRIVHIATAMTNKAAGMAIKAKKRATMSVTSSSFLISRNISFIVLCLLSAGTLTRFGQLAFISIHWPHAVYHSPDSAFVFICRHFILRTHKRQDGDHDEIEGCNITYERDMIPASQFHGFFHLSYVHLKDLPDT